MSELELLEAQLLRLRSEFDDAFSRAPTARDQGLQRFVALRCAGVKYAVALSDVSLLQSDVRVARVPNAAASLLGICCVRGELLAVFDLATCLGVRSTVSGAKMHPSSWIVRASGTNAGFAFEACEGLVTGAIQLTTAGVQLVEVERELIPLLPLRAFVASAREVSIRGVTQGD